MSDIPRIYYGVPMERFSTQEWQDTVEKCGIKDLDTGAVYVSFVFCPSQTISTLMIFKTNSQEVKQASAPMALLRNSISIQRQEASKTDLRVMRG